MSTSGPIPIPPKPPGVELVQLENGLTIIVLEDHTAPVVSAQAWCMTGSIHEGNWLGAGLSHVLEHMLFKGTKTRAGGRIDQEVQEAGGYMNAYTSFDRTVYHIDVPSTGTRVAVDILCDIMQHASLPEEELEKEKQVIRREMDMNVDDPGRRASRRLFETAYTRSPYRYTIIGYPDIFNEVQSADIRAFYQEKYAPNNVFFVVVGDVAAPEVIEQIRQSYQNTRARAFPPFVLPEEPAQTGSREIIEEAPIEIGYLHFAWHIPNLRHPDVPALDVLAALLGNGRSSRLFQNVREKTDLVHSADAWTYSPGNAGLFGMSATTDSDKFDQARTVLLDEIEKMKSGLVGAAELGKAVKQFLAGTLASRKTMQGQAQDLGANWLAANDLNFSERYLAAVKRVTPGDLQRVARHYLTAENRTLYALLPQGSAARVQAVRQSHTDKPVQKFELSNGLRLLVKEDHRLPFVELRAVFRGGVLAETEPRSGLTQLMGKMLLKGAGARSAEQLATEIESVGGSVDSYGGNNSFGVNVEVMKGDFDLAMEVLADVLLRPSFPESFLEREREIQLATVRAQRDHLLQTAFKNMRQTLFGPSGYGLDPLGTEESLARLQIEDVKAFYHDLAVPNNCVLAIYGDISRDEVLDVARKAIGSWAPNKQLPAPTVGGAPAIASLKRVSEQCDKKQAILVLGFGGASLDNDDRYALELLQETCSDLGSRLFLRVREKLGLAYFVGAQNMVGLVPGYFAFYAGTTPEKAAEVEAELLKEAELLRTEGLTSAELERAKAKLVGQRKIFRQDLGNLAISNALDELYGLGFNHWEQEDAAVQKISLEQIKTVAQKYLRTEVAVIAGINNELKS